MYDMACYHMDLEVTKAITKIWFTLNILINIFSTICSSLCNTILLQCLPRWSVINLLRR